MKSNTWMNNPQYLAQVGHTLGGYSFVLTFELLTLRYHWSWWPLRVAIAIGILAASAKEFWFDLRYELPKQTWADSIMDWSFYMVGAMIGCAWVAMLWSAGIR